MYRNPEQYELADNGIFPNSPYPVLHYKKVLQLPVLFAAKYVAALFERNGWSNSWRAGIYTFQHYHSITHEVMAVCRGTAMLQLGGDNGIAVRLQRGDVLVIPAGVAHKNLGHKNSLTCVGAYPCGLNYDMCYGKPGERPAADQRIEQLPLPSTDPVSGSMHAGLPLIWRNVARRLEQSFQR